MVKPLFACLALAALSSAALSQQASTPGEWKVSGSPSGCIAHTTLPQGTVVSVLAGTGQESLLFLIQNRSWESLEDGSRHELAVQLDGGSKFEFDAVAKTELDSDGPGLMFAVPPGEADGARFIAEFAKASGMAVGERGEAIASVRLTGGGSAMTELAQCMSRLWSGGATARQAKPRTAIGAGKAIKL
ncbi:MAG: hypothetical protein M3N39_02195 [Pseudomonadota bacterium]|nr:hypothetical protein [Pseudomonadota bacterium]